MRYEELEGLVSASRLARYRMACANDVQKALRLYRGNIRVSCALLAVLGMFEVVLRNKIDTHYRALFPSVEGWLKSAISPGGFLTEDGCQNSLEKVRQRLFDLGPQCGHDKLLSELSFGFWKYMFAGKQYRAGGNTLLAIFPNLPPKRNQSFIYHKLSIINALRNRIAHHEPICFGRGNSIETLHLRSQYHEILYILSYLGIDPSRLLRGIDTIVKEIDYIDKL